MAGGLRKGRKILIWTGLTVVTTILIVWVLFWNQGRAADKKVAEAKAAGFPLEGADLEELFGSHEGTNAAPLYDKLREKANRLTYTDQRLGQLLAGTSGQRLLTSEQWNDLELFLSEYQPILEDIEQGSQMDYCYFPKNWDDGYMVLFPEFADLKTVTKYISARLSLKLHRGDTRGAVEDLKTLQRFTTHLREQPTLIGLLVSLACDAVIAKTIEYQLPFVETNDEVREVFREYIEQMPESWNLMNTMASEAFWSYWAIENIVQARRMSEILWSSSHGSRDLGGVAMDSVMSTAPSINQITVAVINVWLPFIKDYSPGDDEREVVESLDKRIRAESEKSIFAEIYLDVVSPVYAQVGSSLYKAKARKRSLLAALEVIEYRTAKGQWPDVLPREYIDPFTDKQLQYRLDGEGFRIWSAGVDGHDDGGVTRDENNMNWDEVLIYPPVLEPFVDPSAPQAPPPPPIGVPQVGVNKMP